MIQRLAGVHGAADSAPRALRAVTLVTHDLVKVHPCESY